jgi:hypothetical protein
MNHALGVRQHIDRRHRQCATRRLAQLFGMSGGVLIESRRKGIEIPPEVRVLLRVPEPRARRDPHGADPAVGFDPVLAPILRGSAPRTAVELQDQVAMVLRLGPAESAEHTRDILAIDVRDAPLVPEHLHPAPARLAGPKPGTGTGQDQDTERGRSQRPARHPPHQNCILACRPRTRGCTYDVQ